MNFINESIAFLLKACYSITNHYALALLVFALLIKVILLPLGIKQHKNSIKQASLRPMEAAIVKKYKGRNDRASQQKRQMEIQELQQKAGYSQLAGCLPLIVQLPIIIFIYNVIRAPLTYLCGFTEGMVKTIKDVATANEFAKNDEIALLAHVRDNIGLYSHINEGGVSVTAEALPKFDIFGIDLSQVPKGGAAILLLIPFLTFAFTFLTSKLTRKLSYQSPTMQNANGDAHTSLMIMDIALPLMSAFLSYTVPAVIGIYWMYQNLIGLLQQFIMVKVKPYPVFTEEDYKNAEREILGKKKKIKTGRNHGKDPERPRVPSLHHIDDDEYNSKVVKKDDKKEKSAEKSELLPPVPIKDYNEKNKKK